MRSSGGSLDVAAIARDSQKRICEDLLTTLTAGFAYWWPVNALIFRLVPSQLRPVGMSVCSVVWGCYLSMVQFKKQKGCSDVDDGNGEAKKE